MNKQHEEILEELINKHNFIVQVSTHEDSSDMLMVNFADRKSVYYRLVSDFYGETCGFAYANITDQSEESEGFEEYIPMNKSAIRLFILLDIYRQCRMLGLSTEIVRFFKNGTTNRLVDILPIEMSESEVGDEQLLNEAMDLILNEEFDMVDLSVKLEQAGLLLNFLLLKGLL